MTKRQKAVGAVVGEGFDAPKPSPVAFHATVLSRKGRGRKLGGKYFKEWSRIERIRMGFTGYL
jgi:hypothetical protein